MTASIAEPEKMVQIFLKMPGTTKPTKRFAPIERITVSATCTHRDLQKYISERYGIPSKLFWLNIGTRIIAHELQNQTINVNVRAT
jgi:hypothetical protein